LKESESHIEFSNSEDSSIETGERSKCETCGEEYGQPLLAENLSGSSPEEYYACTRCLSKVKPIAETKDTLELEEEPSMESPEVDVNHELEAEEVKETPVIPKSKIEVNIQSSCQHELGYLKKRDKSSPIPDECLICTKMIDCM
jgi:DNA-directed RNA polymerase subunit RPC12/RpoP